MCGELVLIVVIVTNLLGLLGVIQSIVFPRHRIWPPPGMDSWQFWITWTVLAVATLGVPVVGMMDLFSLGYYNWVMIVTGGVLMFLGSSVIAWGVLSLSLRQSFGLKGGLVTAGPYRYSRNPQYVGYMLFYPGFSLFSGSVNAFLTGLLAILIFIFAPLAEEPWLMEQFGDDYIAYIERVPRFL